MMSTGRGLNGPISLRLLYLVFVGKLHAVLVLVRESLPVPYTLVYILHVFIMYICICLSEFCEKRMPYMYS